MSLSKKKLVFFALTLLFLLVNSMITFHNYQKLTANNGWVLHTQQVLVTINKIRNLSSSVDDPTTRKHPAAIKALGQNGVFFAQVREAVLDLKALTADNPHQHQRVAVLESILAEPQDSKKAWWRGANEASFQLREILALMRQEENHLLGLRAEETSTSIQATGISFALEAGLAMFFIYLTYIFLNQRIQAEKIGRLGEAQAIENIKDYSIIMIDPEGKVLTWNAGAERIKGYKAFEIIGKNMSIFYTPEDQAKGHPEELLKIASEKGRVEDEGWRVRKDGSRFLDNLVITALKDEKGESRGFIKVTRDVTEIKKAQKELQEKTELLDSVLKNIGDGVVVADEKGKFIVFNPAAEKIIGFGAVEGPTNEWTKKYGVFLPDQLTPFPEKDLPLVKAIHGEETHEVEQFLKNANHPEGVSIHVSGRPIKHPDGRIRGGVVIVRDITERKRAEEEIKQANIFLNTILENIPNMIFMKDAKDLRFVMFNKAGEELLGVPKADLIGKNDYDFFSRQDADFFTSKDRKTLESGKLLDIPEEPLQTRDRGVRTLHTKKIPILNEDRTPQYLLGISEDITERKAQENLKVYTKALETSNQELQDFVFVASHDLQEPLRKIQAFGGFLADEFKETLGETGQDYVERMRSAASRMQILINDLLALTRVTTKAQPFIPTNLSQVIEGVLSDLETRIQETKAKVEVGQLPTLEVDGTQMRQLFQNLVGNALKFQKPGVPPEIHIHGEVLNDAGPDGKQCRIRVEDNGIGFDNQYADQIFKVFERLHGRDEYEGTGIGLAICRKVVERHKGTIQAEGIPGKGSTFTITLPVKQKR